MNPLRADQPVTEEAVIAACDYIYSLNNNVKEITLPAVKEVLGKTGKTKNTLQFIREWKESLTKGQSSDKPKTTTTQSITASFEAALNILSEEYEEKLAKEREESEKCIEDMNEELENAQLVNKELLSFKESISSSLDALANNNNKLNLDLQSAHEKLHKSELHNAQLSEQIEQAREHNKALELKIKEGNSKYLEFIDELKQVKINDNNLFSESLDKMRLENNQLQNALEQLQVKYTEAKVGLHNAVEQINENGSVMEQAKNELVALSSEVDEYKQTIHKLISNGEHYESLKLFISEQGQSIKEGQSQTIKASTGQIECKLDEVIANKVMPALTEILKISEANE
ncbi:DNA-binding protein [Pseudoalteromonas marina]|uniref:DNA-binding protein n=1 Tax=Pseudoalteromonas marina TaxID=267375 RepID=A0ABT9FI46_9GAMM|nr:DNA-binding protein [Pseudoalteromonas marina]MDP2566445.1 DNA-binding protein [Pseudoalteromonas marina]